MKKEFCIRDCYIGQINGPSTAWEITLDCVYITADEGGEFEAWKLIHFPIENSNIDCNKLIGKKLIMEIK